jgi:transposase
MYSIQIRQLVVNLYKKLKNLILTASLVGISKSTISRWNINIERKPYPKRTSKLSTPLVIDVVKTFIKTNPLSTIREVQEQILTTCKINASLELIRIFMVKSLQLSNKKAYFYPLPSEKQKVDRTKDFCNRLIDSIEKNAHSSIVSVDEIGFGDNVKPLKGWGLRNQKLRIFGRFSTKRSKHTSCCCSISIDGAITVMMKNGYFNKLSFLQFLQKQTYPEKTLILLDNVQFHHSKEVVSFCKEHRWTLLHTPPYSPWFNPIENVFSIVKCNFRKHRNIYKAFESVSKNSIDNIFLALFRIVEKNT